MKENIRYFFLLALIPICSVLHGEDTVDPDTLIAHVKERIAYLEKLYEQGIEVESEGESLDEGGKDPHERYLERVVYRDHYELSQVKPIYEDRDASLNEKFEEVITARNPHYSFLLGRKVGSTEYKIEEFFNDRDGILIDQNTNGLLYSTTDTLIGVFLGEVRLRDVLESDTLKVESVERSENQYRFVFRSDVKMDEYHHLRGGELFFNADDYALEESNLDVLFYGPDVRTISITRHAKYT